LPHYVTHANPYIQTSHENPYVQTNQENPYVQTNIKAANKASVSGSGSSDDRSYHQDTNVKAANIETPNYQGTNKASGKYVNY
jgi:hypothetical protein